MASQEKPWAEAIIAVLRDTGLPLHYHEITKEIAKRELRTLSGATPVATVRGCLNRMTTQENRLYNGNILKIDRGVYQIVDQASLLEENDEVEQFDNAIDEQTAVGPQITGVTAFGLYWRKDRVNWGRGSSGILGRQNEGADLLDFSHQQGIYLLHNDRSVVYVGRTVDALRRRLNYHFKEKNALRWDKFSWFGFSGVNYKAAELELLPRKMDTRHLFNILESVLIEALAPPVNGHFGDNLGAL